MIAALQRCSAAAPEKRQPLWLGALGRGVMLVTAQPVIGQRGDDPAVADAVAMTMPQHPLEL